MNYRRGLQRIFFVLATAWLALAVFMILYGYWQPQYSPLVNGGWSFTDQGSPTPPDFGNFLNEDMRRRWLWSAMVGMIPPLLAYGILFYVGPWIRRGFRSSN